MILIPTYELPALPYRIEYSSNSRRMDFIMCGAIRHDLRIHNIVISKKGTLYFHMETNNKHDTLSRRIETSISSIEEGIEFVNEYLCQTAFQLNALRGHGFKGYIEIDDLQGASLNAKSNGNLHIKGKDGTEYKYFMDTDTWYILTSENDAILQFDVKNIPWQVVIIAEEHTKQYKEKK